MGGVHREPCYRVLTQRRSQCGWGASEEHTGNDVLWDISATKSSVELKQEHSTYGRGEGLVDSPRLAATSVFPPIPPRGAAVHGTSPSGVQRGEHRGYIGLPASADAPRLRGDRYGA